MKLGFRQEEVFNKLVSLSEVIVKRYLEGHNLPTSMTEEDFKQELYMKFLEEIKIKKAQWFKNKNTHFLEQYIYFNVMGIYKRNSYNIKTNLEVDEEADYEEIIKNTESENNTEEEACIKILAESLKKELDTLTPREAKILILRFGLGTDNPRTFKEVSREFNVTRERIRQIEAKALRKLRHPSRALHLIDYLDGISDEYFKREYRFSI